MEKPALCLGAGRDTLVDFGKELPSACRIAALLAGRETRLRLPFGNNMRDKVVK